MKIFIVSSNLNVGVRPLDFWFDNIWISSRGLTGSDLGFVKIAQELRMLGHEVSLFTIHAQPHNKPDTWDGMNLYNLEELPKIVQESNDLDVIISINDCNVFFNLPRGPLRILIEYLNDFPFAQPNWEDEVDLCLGACEEHTEYLKKQVTKPEKWNTLTLGCCPEWYSDKRIPGRVIWTSSADRGLHWLLSQWPEIKKSVPEASLRIFYHFDYGDINKIEPNSTVDHPHIIEMAQRIRYITYALEKLKSLDVEHMGSISRVQMQQEFSEASVFAFSCDTIAFSEGFSVSTLEAHASNTVPIITNQDCLGSVYKNSGAIIVNSPIKNNLPEFTSNVIKALTDKEYSNSIIANCKEFAKENTWFKVAKKLENYIKELKHE